MKPDERTKKTGLHYYHLKRMNYYPAAKPPDILDDIGIVGDDHQGDLSIEWIFVGGETAARIRAFDDAWGCLQMLAGVLPDLIDLAARGNVKPVDVCRILDAHGIEDRSDKPLET